MTWENGIFGMVSKEDWLSVPFTPPVIASDPIDVLFGNEKTDNIGARWDEISADQLVPSMAQFHAFDTEAIKTVSPVLTNHYIEKGLIKVKQNQSERLQQLRKQGVINDDAMYRYVINDGARLARAVDVRARVAKNEALATGQVTIGENNLSLTIDYGVSAAQKSFTLDLGPESEVPSQIQAILDVASEKGVVITGMITSKRNLTKMRNNHAIQIAKNGVNSTGALVSNTELRAYLSDEFGIDTIIVQDNVYNANIEEIDTTTGKLKYVPRRYYPQDKITFFATPVNGSRLGVGLWGDPPEVVNPLTQTTGSGVSPYVYIHQWTENDPAVLWTKASSLFIPVIYNPSGLYIATVITSAGDGA